MIINYAQILALFSYFNCSTTPELDGFLSGIFRDSSIPNLYDYVVDPDYDVVTMPDRFTVAYDHPLFLDIVGHICTLWYVLMFALAFSVLLKTRDNELIRKIGLLIYDELMYNGLIRMILESLVYIFLGSFLTFRYGIALELHSVVNTFLSVIVLFLTCAFTYAVFRVINHNVS